MRQKLHAVRLIKLPNVLIVIWFFAWLYLFCHSWQNHQITHWPRPLTPAGHQKLLTMVIMLNVLSSFVKFLSNLFYSKLQIICIFVTHVLKRFSLLEQQRDVLMFSHVCESCFIRILSSVSCWAAPLLRTKDCLSIYLSLPPSASLLVIQQRCEIRRVH